MWEDDAFVIVYDKYPKSRMHLLIVPKTKIDSVKYLRREHMSMLRILRARAAWLVEGLRKSQETSDSSALCFRAGFHAVPSLRQLHLHVISQDFQSPCLKNKKHWLSFTSDFFLPISKVIEQVTRQGKVVVDEVECEKLLKGPLSCHRCGKILANMPKLRDHIGKCEVPVPAGKIFSFH